MHIRVINKSRYPLPQYETENSAGVDLHANIEEPFLLEPLQRRVVPTGIYVSVPNGYEGQVRPRSGLAAKKGITVLNAPGTIDADYRGEIGVILVNLSDASFRVNPGERIAQLVFAKCERVDFVPVDELDETARGEGGFGSTGLK